MTAIPVTLRGRLAIAAIRAGTASEQRALVLDANDGLRYTLVKLDGPSFGLPEEARWAGRDVEVSGHPLGNELRYTRLVPF